MYDNQLKKLLRKIFLYGDSEHTVTDAAAACDVSEKTFYKYTSKESTLNIPAERLRTLAQYMVSERNDYRLAEWLLPGCRIAVAGHHETDGCIDDEVIEINIIEGEIIRLVRSGDRELALQSCRKLINVAERLRVEIENS